MSNQGFFGIDPATEQEIFISYQDLEDEVIQAFIKPVGGFIFPANLFARSHLPKAPFYVRDWLPKRGKSLLYGSAKVGKSYLCLQLARCVGSGLPLLGLPTTQGIVLYIQLELGEEILQYRMKNETKQDYDNVYIGTTFSMKLDSKNGQDQLWRAMEAVEPQVLILDPLYKAILGDENEAHDILRILDFLDSVIEGFNCSILLIHHAGKNIERRGRGSSVLEDWVDSYLRIKRTSKKGQPLTVEIEPIFLRHASLPPDPIAATLGKNFEFCLVNEGATVKQQIIILAEELKEFSPKDLFEAGIGSNTSVYEALQGLTSGGQISKLGRGRYMWFGGGLDKG